MFKIKKLRMEEIEAIADHILVDNNLLQPGFDLIRFLRRKEGFEVALQYYMPDGAKACILVNHEENIAGTGTKRLIVVNNDVSCEKEWVASRRFLIAHEYAHYKLYKVSGHRYSSKECSVKKQEADLFARCLLLPKTLVEKILAENSIKQLNDRNKRNYLATVFNVPKKIAKQRLKELFKNNKRRESTYVN